MPFDTVTDINSNINYNARSVDHFGERQISSQNVAVAITTQLYIILHIFNCLIELRFIFKALLVFCLLCGSFPRELVTVSSLHHAVCY